MSDSPGSDRAIEPASIGIVGGGAAGTLVAVNLLRELDFPAEILLIDKSGEFGPGIPYRTPNPEHRLNVPAIRMSAFVDEPSHFLQWLKSRDPEAADASYASRGTYGEYLKELLREAELNCPRHLSLTRIAGEVTDARLENGPGATGHGPVRMTLDGVDVKLDHLVIATGPVGGGDPVPVPESLREKGIYVPNSWDEEAVLPALGDEHVLIIGTGLTMVDVALTLGAGRGIGTGSMVRAVSRNGLVPKPHREGLTNISAPSVPAEGPVGINDLLGAFSTELLRAGTEGRGWRDAIDSMRSVTPSAWRRLSRADKLWFIQNLNRIWEVHRYRIAPRVAASFDELLASGRLTVQAARIGSIEDAGSRAKVNLLTASGTETAEFDRVISACGASTSVSVDAPAPIPSLIGSGAIRADHIDLGLDADRDGAIRDSEGNRSPFFSTLGSLRRGVEWETIGVTELRWQSAEIARRLATELGKGTQNRSTQATA